MEVEEEEIAAEQEKEEIKESDNDESPQMSHKNAFLRTSDNTPEEKDNIGCKYGETVMTFLDMKESLS